MIVAISQPTLYPWIGYFDIINRSDTFVFLDNAQLNRKSWQTRNKIKNPTPTGDAEIWLNIPVKKSELSTTINKASIDDTKNWRRKHLAALKASYGKNMNEIKWLEELFTAEWKSLAVFNIEFIKKCCEYLDISTNFLLSSEIGVKGVRTQWLVDICKKLDADVYLTTSGAKDMYLEKESHIFEEENISIQYHDYVHPEYNQHGDNFVSHLSILDLILNLKTDAKRIFK